MRERAKQIYSPTIFKTNPAVTKMVCKQQQPVNVKLKSNWRINEKWTQNKTHNKYQDTQQKTIRKIRRIKIAIQYSNIRE